VTTVDDVLQGGRWFVKHVKLALKGIGGVPQELQEDLFLREYGWTHREYMETPYETICYLQSIIEQRRIVEKEIQEEEK